MFNNNFDLMRVAADSDTVVTVTKINELLNYFWNTLTWAGGLIAIVGIIRWVMAGSNHDAAAQQQTVWIIITGGVLVAIGMVASTWLAFPDFGGD